MKTLKLLISLFSIFILNIGNAQKAGDLDNSFSYNGIKMLQIGDYFSGGESVAIQNDGKIVIVGNVDGQIAVTRLNTDGSQDSSFGNNGIQITETQYDADANAVAIQKDGKIVIAGDYLVRYNIDGTLDNSFSEDGIQNISNYATYSLAIQEDGKILVAGTIFGSSESGYDFAVSRYNIDGSLDNSFSNDGKQIIACPESINQDQDVAYSIVIQKDGKIVVAGYAAIENICVVRLNNNGTLDNSFSGDGISTISFGNDANVKSVVIQSDGKIVVAGSFYNGKNNDLFIARLNNDGTIEESFVKEGIQACSIGSGNDYGNAVALQKDGKIIVAGSSGNGINYDFAVVCFNKDGTLDDSFSNDGIQTTDIRFGNDYGNSVAIQKDGKIVVAGEADGNFAIARYWGPNTTSIINQTETASSNFYIYPNPAHEIVFVDGLKQPGEIEILNLQGNVISCIVVEVETTGVDISNLISGVYLLKFSTNGESIIKKIVKL